MVSDKKWTPEGPHSYYITLTIGTAIIADNEEAAKQIILNQYVKALPATGWESYGVVEWKIVPGPPISPAKKGPDDQPPD
jgi:hypothetical protein